MSQQTGATRRPNGRYTALRARLESWSALTVCLLGVAASAIVMATGHWRRGAMIFAVSVLLAGLLRAVLPDQLAGVLAVRARWVDSLLLLGLGTFMVIVILTR
ncbi:DUF3017 domain-containing protein [Cutibacterium sp.]|uniref:DUF3017 domain-containing protein n=1 Tax=Cutibacterium sp. TaxID=1912221 RepID=UPI0026DDACB3|nr:DUF3017 domain-containing protein [Cutibacterium sp.]MDO4413202.1 DUF3017 domain-containing protein [Cutibacterium sp.]